MTERPCTRCPAIVGTRNKTGLCRVCHNSDPALIAKRARGVSATRRRRLAEDPVFAAQAREHGKWLGLTQNGNAHKTLEVRRRGHLKASDKALPWCPRERRAEYKRLVRNGGMTPAMARARIEADIEAELKEAPPLTRFERQMEAVRRGAGIIEMPRLPRTGPAYTLGGVTEALF